MFDYALVSEPHGQNKKHAYKVNSGQYLDLVNFLFYQFTFGPFTYK